LLSPILNWNGVALLEKYLPSVVAHSETAKIYIIDNDSSDNSKEFIAANFPSVEWIQNEKNYGFAEGYNHGLKKIEAKYFLILNSDVRVSEGY